MAVVSIYMLFTISFFADFFVDRELLPAQFTLLTEILVYLFFLYSLVSHKKGETGFRWHLIYTFIFTLLIAGASVVLNEYYTPRVIFSIRIFWRFFVFYIAIINIGFEESDFKKINKFISFLLILQLPIVATQFYIHGGIVETNFGSFSEGGAVTTMFPIVAIMYLAGYFAFYKRSFIYPLLGVGFMAWSVVGAKKAVLYLFPVALLGIYYFIYFKGKHLRLSKHISYLSLVIAILIAVSVVILKLNPKLNPERKVGGSANLQYALNYTMEYTTSVSAEDPSVTRGRFSTLIHVFETLKDAGFATVLLGYGPGAFTESIFGYTVDRRLAKLKASYGMTPLTYLSIEYGILGLIAYSLIILTFLRMCWKYYFYETDPYWKAFAVGSLGLSFFMIFLFCAYNSNSLHGDSFPVLYFYIMGVIFVRLNKTERYRFSEKANRVPLQENI
jgi:hypothetical protein